MSDVLVLDCPNYLLRNVYKAVARAFSECEVKLSPGMTVLVKPNLLMAKAPAHACTTHPAVMDAICKVLSKSGCRIIIGESSGWHTMRAFEVSGIKAVAEKYGARLVAFEDERPVTKRLRGRVLKEIKIASLLDEVDAVINVPKMKTHSFMKVTGAVKNCYGFIPGLHKAFYHTKGKDEVTFGRLVVDLYSSCKDKIIINIMDAVVGMEGEGPGNGDPKNTGLIIASVDAAALDVVQAKVMGFEPLAMPVIKAFVERKVLDVSSVRVIGDHGLRSLPRLRYRPAGTGNRMNNFLSTAKSLLFRSPSLIPDVYEEKCVRCGICAKLCPEKCIALQPYPVFDRKKCILCYCCHEHCPHGAIFLRK